MDQIRPLTFIISAMICAGCAGQLANHPVDAITSPHYPQLRPIDTLDVIKLYDDSVVNKYCVGDISSDIFSNCVGPMASVSMWSPPNQPTTAGYLHIRKSPLCAAVGEIECDDMGDERISTYPFFLGRQYMFNNCYITSFGQIFDTEHRYMTGKFCDDDDEKLSTIRLPHGISMQSIPVIDYNGVVLVAVHPYDAFGHEFLELFPQLVAFRRLLVRHPDIPVLVRAPLRVKKMFPILEYFGIFPSKLRYQVFGVELSAQANAGSPPKSVIYRFQQMITTVSSFAAHVDPAYIILFREAVDSLFPGYAIPNNHTSPVAHNWIVAGPDPPSIYTLSGPDKGRNGAHTPTRDAKLYSEPGDLPRACSWARGGIVFADRREGEVTGSRNLEQGGEIFSALQERYGATRQVELFTGKESLQETVRLLRCADVFISIHGSQMANMMFLRPGAVMVEIQPRYYTFDVFLNLAPSLGVKAYRYRAVNGGKYTPVIVNFDDFISKIFVLID